MKIICIGYRIHVYILFVTSNPFLLFDRYVILCRWVCIHIKNYYLYKSMTTRHNSQTVKENIVHFLRCV